MRVWNFLNWSTDMKSTCHVKDISSFKNSALVVISSQAFHIRKNTAYHVQTGSGAHPAFYPMGTGALCQGVKRPGREADHSPPTSAEVKKMWIFTSTPPYAFMT
jgi:hypothetical protein